MNCAVYIKGSNNIQWFVKDCFVKVTTDNWHISGNIKLLGVKKSLFNLLWTSDVALPIYDGSGNLTGWDKLVSELTPGQGIEIAEETTQGVVSAHGIRGQIASMTYAQVDTYIENNVTDMASAKAFLKILAKAVLATIKIQDSR